MPQLGSRSKEMPDETPKTRETAIIETLRAELAKSEPSRRRRGLLRNSFLLLLDDLGWYRGHHVLNGYFVIGENAEHHQGRWLALRAVPPADVLLQTQRHL
jgi:hypothetical protein